jgi:hypothetical protein
MVQSNCIILFDWAAPLATLKRYEMGQAMAAKQRHALLGSLLDCSAN